MRMCRRAAGRYMEKTCNARPARDTSRVTPLPLCSPHKAEAEDAVATDMDDEALARRVIDAAPGIDAGAEAEFYRRFAPRVRLYGRKHLRDAHLAEDLMQQVMVLTLESLRDGRVRDPARIVSFVLGACRMTVIDLKRTGARRQALLERHGNELVADTVDDPAPAIDRERLLACLERLAARERTVIVASFFDGRDANEVAAMASLAPGNVRVIRHRALEQLRTCMGAGDGR